MRNKVITATVLLIGLCGVTFGPTHARTWYVNVSGTGDAPTIEAALDSAVAGDTVLVGPGDYTTMGVTVGRDVVIASEMGPLSTRVHAPGPGMASGIFDLRDRAELHGFWISGGYLQQVFTNPDCLVNNNIINGAPGAPLSVTDQCTISNNLFLDGAGIYVNSVISPWFLNNIVLCPVECQTVPVAVCNNFLDTASPCVQILLADPSLQNFSADPQFCGVEGNDNYYLQSDSPCAEGNTPHVTCGQVGPLPVGCSAVKTEARSWGEVKALYQ